MEITFQDLGLKIATHGSGLCYELFEWQSGDGVVSRGRYVGKERTAKWVTMGRYPSSIESAVEQVYEFAVLKSGVSIDNPQKLSNELKTIRSSIVDALPESVPSLVKEVR